MTACRLTCANCGNLRDRLFQRCASHAQLRTVHHLPMRSGALKSMRCLMPQAGALVGDAASHATTGDQKDPTSRGVAATAPNPHSINR
jgi:hypothetical protein